ncbi:unnamed protein product [Polarella glacialis]|uniref:AP2/ERF domain-containing protein n=1 Tax=Polarella glacialis TaxID=89957 RepID=A0A813IKX7_POLGL|nr:unnamed protein product [Polarella glacialis]
MLHKLRLDCLIRCPHFCAAAYQVPGQAGGRPGSGGSRRGKAALQSKFRGVHWNSRTQMWCSTMVSSDLGKLLHLGSFKDEFAAAVAYDCAAMNLRGTDARRNFPNRIPSDEETLQAHQRMMAHRSPRKTSCFTGVCRKATSDKWFATLSIARKAVHLGAFQDEADAARAFDVAFRASQPCRAFLLRSINFPLPEDYFDTLTWHDQPLPAERSSRFMGVYFAKALRKFRSHVGPRTIGAFTSELEAARAFDQVSMVSGGRTNFSPGCYVEVRQCPVLQFSSSEVSRDQTVELLSTTQAYFPVHSFVAERCQAEAKKGMEAASSAEASLHASRSALAVTDFDSQRVLWQSYFDSERRQGSCRQSTASEWRFKPEDALELKAWPGDAGIPTVQCGAYDVLGVVSAADLPELLVAQAARAPQRKLNKASVQLQAKLREVLCAFGLAVSQTECWPLAGFAGNEAQSRMLIDTILFEVCKQSKLTLIPEESLPASAPVPGIVDYVLRRGPVTVAVVEAKRCLSCEVGKSHGQEGWATVLTGGLAQALTLVAGLASASCRPLGVVTDARRWLLLELPAQGPPVLQCWPGGGLMLELSGPAELELLLQCLGQLLAPKSSKPEGQPMDNGNQRTTTKT